MEVRRTVEINPGDTLVVWWSNGHGYDLWTVGPFPKEEGPAPIVYKGSEEWNGTDWVPKKT